MYLPTFWPKWSKINIKLWHLFVIWSQVSHLASLTLICKIFPSYKMQGVNKHSCPFIILPTVFLQVVLPQKFQSNPSIFFLAISHTATGNQYPNLGLISPRWGRAGWRRLQFPYCHKDQPYDSDLQTQAAVREFRGPFNTLLKHTGTKKKKKILRITAQKLRMASCRPHHLIPQVSTSRCQEETLQLQRVPITGKGERSMGLAFKPFRARNKNPL